MKKLSSIILALFILAMFNMRTYAQDIRLVKTKVADILMLMPAKNAEETDKLVVLTIGLGDEALVELFAMLKAPGEGNDVAARYMLTSMARYTSQKGHEKEWDWVQSNFLKAIQASANKEVQTYLIEQLIYGANDQCINPLKKYLINSSLCQPVTLVFLVIADEKAGAAFIEALPLATGISQITIVKALGKLQYKPALSDITKLEGSTDVALQRSVLFALANIGSPESYKLLWAVADEVSFTDDPTEASAAFLSYCDRLGAANELNLCKKACLAVIKANTKETQLHNQAAALKIYSKYFKAEVMPLLLKAVNNQDYSFRMAVLNIAVGIPGATYTTQWISEAKKAKDPVRGDIMYMLGNRADKSAVPYVRQSLNDKSDFVRQEAIWALVKLDPQNAVSDLINHLSKGDDVAVTEKALGTLLDEKNLDKVALALNTASDAGKPGLINLIASKSGKRFFAQVFAYTASNDPAVRSAAIAALKNIASYDNLAKLIQLLPEVENPGDISGVQKAIVKVVKDQGAIETAINPVIEAVGNSSQKEKLIPVLPLIGGKKALNTVADLYSTSEGTLKAASFKALVSWKDADAAPYLYEICVSANPEFRSAAFMGFVRQVEDSKLFDDQKLLKLQMIMPLAQNTAEKGLVLNALSNIKTFLCLVYLGQYLNDPELQQSAAQSAAAVALPDGGKQNGFYGQIPKDILTKVLQVIAGPESDYTKENIKRYLEIMPADQGFVSMFNGTDLSGWKGYITDPIKLAKLSDSEKAAKQLEADKKMSDNWNVKDGMIVFNGDGNNLLSTKEFGDFELFVNWRIRKKGDSGLYLRGTPQVQIWDTSRVEVGAQVGSGGLYNNQKNPANPLKVADNPVGDWNTFHIIMIGDKVTVYLNGELVVDNTVLENYWDRNIPIFPKGTIELQAHGTDLAFKDIFVREISKTEVSLLPHERAEGFELLFNGNNLNGWVGDTINYQARDRMIVIEPQKGRGGGNLFTEKEYGDFNFRFEFQLTPAANNGLGIRAPLEGDAAYVGMELQILDNEAPVYAKLEPYQYHGSVYGVIPAKRGFLKPVGEWNTEEVIVVGKKVKVILNGTVIVDGDIEEASRNGTMDHNQHPGLLRDKGHIGFLGHGSVVKFRNIRIKAL